MAGNGMTRREFIKKGLTIVAVGYTAPSFLTRTAFAMNNPWDVAQAQAASGAQDPILVVVQLSGGNDGLNTVVPHAHDEYYRARPTLGIARDQVLRLSDEVGLHPNLKKLKSLYDNGRMAVIQAVGYPNPDRSHFRSMEIWHTADPEGRAQSFGWIGRYFDNTCSGCQPHAGVNVGATTPLAMRGEKGLGVALETPEMFTWLPTAGGIGSDEIELWKMLNTPAGVPQGPIDFLRHTAMNAHLASEAIRNAAGRYAPKVEYPNHRFGQDLKLISRLIAGGSPTRVYYCSLGGFDTHANQRSEHERLLTWLTDGVDAFYRDLEDQGNADRVLVMAFSEFGRRVAENASLGTDHGAGAPMLVFGKRVRGGVYGRHPSLTDLADGDLRFAVDFR